MSLDEGKMWRRDALTRLSGAPWPLVERRAGRRVLEVDTPVLRLPRQPSSAHEPLEVAGPRITRRRVLPADGASSRRQRAHALLGDLVGVVLLVVVGAGSPAAVVLSLVWCLVLALVELTAPPDPHAQPRRVLVAGLALTLAVPFAAFAVGADLARSLVLVAVPLAAGISFTGRAAATAGAEHRRRVVLVGGPESVAPTHALLVRSGGPEVTVVGICCPRSASAPASICGVPVVGDLDELAPTVWRGGVDDVVICSTAETSGPVLRKILWDLEGSGANVLVAPGVVELGPTRLHLTALSGLPLVRISDPHRHGLDRSLKHVVDRLAAALGLLVLAPLLLTVCLAVRCTSPGPALFWQQRVGYDGRTFTIVKFRSMRVDADEGLAGVSAHNRHAAGPLFKAEQDPRVTPVGRLLRRTSVDELPQLWNVLRGDMSLVGPRPPLPSEVLTYSDAVPRRLLVRPGLTGLWQVSGRSDLSWDDSARLDLYYVENWSIGLDVSILCRTFGAVLRGRGAY